MTLKKLLMHRAAKPVVFALALLPFAWLVCAAALDALGANPDFVKQVTTVLQKNPDELFMFATRPQGAPAPVIVVNQVKETRVQPFTGDKAREFAVNYLRNQRIQAALKAEVEKQQKAMADRVVYQEGWAPPKPKTPDAAAVAGARPTGPTIPSPTPEPALPGVDHGMSVPAAPAVPAGEAAAAPTPSAG